MAEDGQPQNDTAEGAAQGGGEAQGEMHFSLQRIYVKDLSLEVPGAPGVFKQDWDPDINMEFNSYSTRVEESLYEVVLKLRVTAKNQEQVAFMVELEQAGLFRVRGMPEERMEHLLGSYCPSILFPYARESVSDAVNRGSFPQLLLAPVNFDALYAEARKRRQQEQEQAESSTAGA